MTGGQIICVPLELVFLRGEKKKSSLSHKAGSWYLLFKLPLKISDEHPAPRALFIWEFPWDE